MKIAQVNANENYINNIAKEAMDGETGIKDISNKANNQKPESACVYNQGETLDTDGFGLFLSEEDVKGNNSSKTEEELQYEEEQLVDSKLAKEYVENIDKIVVEEAAAIEEAVAELDETTIVQTMDMEVSLEEYTKDTLDRAISRVVTARADNAKQLEAQVEKLKEENADIEEAVVSRIEDKIERELRAHGASLSKATIAQIQSALAMSMAVADVSIASANSLIRQNLAPTIANVYKSGYNHSMAKDTYYLPEGLKGQIENIITESGLEDKEYLMTAAGAMIEDKLPVTSESLKLHMEMKQAKDNYSEDGMLNKIVDNVAKGGNPMDTLVTKDAVAMKLDSLGEMFKDLEATSPVEAFLATRTLNEVRLAMSSEASIKMAVKNIDINVTDITDALNQLKAIEEKLYVKMFLGTDMNLSQAKEASANMCKVERSLSLVSYNKEVLVSTTFTARETTLGGFENAINRYEQSATEVRKDLGDSFKKAFDSIPDLLNELSLENTQRNVRAVRELSYASIEITVENVEQMKAYDMSFDTMVSNLTPSVTRKLIEDGINPLDMTVEELNAKALEIKKELGVNDMENYAQFLFRLDKEGSISKEMRDAYVGIYRLIKNIQNTDGAAVSTAYKAGMEMTLSNLLTCVRTYKSKGVDSFVSDELGSASLEVKADVELSIDAQINKIAYFNRVVDNLADKVSPQLIKEYETQTGKEFIQENIEVLEDMAGDPSVTKKEGYVEGSKAFGKAILDNAKEGLENASENAVMLHNLGLEVNLGNLIQMHGYGNTLAKRVKKTEETDDNNDVNNIPTNEDLDDIFASEEALENKLNQLYDEIVDEVKALESESIEPDRIMQASMLMKSVSFSRKMMDKGCFEIPLSTDAGITNIRLQFAKGEENVRQASIFMDDPVMGEVNVSIKLKGDAQIKGFITCETRALYDFFAKENVSLVNQLDSQGIGVISMDFALGRKTRSFSETYIDEKAGSSKDNKILLTATKITIRHIMKGIGENNENQS